MLLSQLPALQELVDSPDLDEQIIRIPSTPPVPTTTEELNWLLNKHENSRITDHEDFTRTVGGVACMTTANKLLSAEVDEMTAIKEHDNTTSYTLLSVEVTTDKLPILYG
jgi:hypothetical protein